MTVKFTGTPPAAVVPTPKPLVKQPINLDATKTMLVGALATAVNLQTAAEKLKEAAFRLNRDTLEIQTNLSATMVRMVFDDDCIHLMESELVKRGAGNIRIKLLPAPTPAASGNSASGLTSELVSAPFKRLVDSAVKLNKVSDQLTNRVEQIDAALKQLNLGVRAWVTVTNTEDEDGNCLVEELGYVRIGSRWGVALKTASGVRGERGDETFSAFADAPRQLRIRAVPYIPKLIDQLSVEAEAMIAKLSPEVDEVSALALALQASGVKK